MECKGIIESEIRYTLSFYEPHEEDLPEEDRFYLNKLRQCLITLEEPLMQFTRAVINEVKPSARNL